MIRIRIEGDTLKIQYDIEFYRSVMLPMFEAKGLQPRNSSFIYLNNRVSFQIFSYGRNSQKLFGTPKTIEVDYGGRRYVVNIYDDFRLRYIFKFTRDVVALNMYFLRVKPNSEGIANVVGDLFIIEGDKKTALEVFTRALNKVIREVINVRKFRYSIKAR